MASGRLHLIGLQLRQGTYELDRHWQRRWPLPGLAHAWEAGKAARQGCPPAELRRLRSLNTVISLRVNASAAFPKGVLRGVGGFRNPERTQAFLSSFGPTAFRARAASAACLTLSQTACLTIC